MSRIPTPASVALALALAAAANLAPAAALAACGDPTAPNHQDGDAKPGDTGATTPSDGHPSAGPSYGGPNVAVSPSGSPPESSDAIKARTTIPVTVKKTDPYDGTWMGGWTVAILTLGLSTLLIGMLRRRQKALDKATDGVGDNDDDSNRAADAGGTSI